MLLSTCFQKFSKTSKFGLKPTTQPTGRIVFSSPNPLSRQHSILRTLKTTSAKQTSYSQSNTLVSSRSPLLAATRAYASQASSNAGGRRISLTKALVFSGFLASSSYLLGLFAPPDVFTLLNPRPAPPPPPEDSEEAKLIIAKVEKELNELEVLKRHREAPDASEWYEARPYVGLPPEKLLNHFTGGVIRGPTKIAVPPIVRSRKDETETWVFIHLGRGVCGHEGIVHGGLLATLLDEGCARPAALAFPSHVAVTANLNLNFRAPTKADQFVIMKTKLVEIKGRKGVVDGWIETLDGRVLVEARGLYVEPKLASQLHNAGVSSIYPSLHRNIEKMAGAPQNHEQK